VPLLALGVAPSSLAGAAMWLLLVAGGDEEQQTPPPTPPAAPWCASRLEPGLAWHPEAKRWLEDIVPCIAWAWVERPKP